MIQLSFPQWFPRCHHIGTQKPAVPRADQFGKPLNNRNPELVFIPGVLIFFFKLRDNWILNIILTSHSLTDLRLLSGQDLAEKLTFETRGKRPLTP